jgi:hypothetical protein
MRTLLNVTLALSLCLAYSPSFSASKIETFNLEAGQKVRMTLTFQDGSTRSGRLETSDGLSSINFGVPEELGPNNLLTNKQISIYDTDGSIKVVSYEINISGLPANFNPITLPVLFSSVPGQVLLERVDFSIASSMAQNQPGEVIQFVNGVAPNLAGVELFDVTALFLNLPPDQVRTITSADFGNFPRYSGNASIDSNFLTAAVPEPEAYAMLMTGLGLLVIKARRGTQKSAV